MGENKINHSAGALGNDGTLVNPNVTAVRARCSASCTVQPGLEWKP